MNLSKLDISNYKSLKNVSIEPSQISLIIGANASGKTNLTDSIDFLSEVYKYGLEVAVSRKGGYENIAFRKVRRSKSPIQFSVCAEMKIPLRALNRTSRNRRFRTTHLDFRMTHSFSFAAFSTSISSEFEVRRETIEVSVLGDLGWEKVAILKRNKNHTVTIDNSEEEPASIQRSFPNEHITDFTLLSELVVDEEFSIPSTELMTNNFIGRVSNIIRPFVASLGSLRVFQISPATSRTFGVPTPNPELGRWGDNLPTIIDHLKKTSPQQWKSILQTMRSILPELEDIDVGYTPSRTLGLFFHEQGPGRAWSVDEVSDGTIQTLALLVAIFGPSSSFLLIEEPENSIHPWIIRHVIDACKVASETKQIIMTTHSPIVVNLVDPFNLWVMWRKGSESQLKKVEELDEDLLTLWQTGEISTFEYLDSGALLEAIPPAPSSDTDE